MIGFFLDLTALEERKALEILKSNLIETVEREDLVVYFLCFLYKTCFGKGESESIERLNIIGVFLEDLAIKVNGMFPVSLESLPDGSGYHVGHIIIAIY